MVLKIPLYVFAICKYISFYSALWKGNRFFYKYRLRTKYKCTCYISVVSLRELRAKFKQKCCWTFLHKAQKNTYFTVQYLLRETPILRFSRRYISSQYCLGSNASVSPFSALLEGSFGNYQKFLLFKRICQGPFKQCTMLCRYG
jgi:hypothetical protein